MSWSDITEQSQKSDGVDIIYRRIWSSTLWNLRESKKKEQKKIRMISKVRKNKKVWANEIIKRKRKEIK